MSNVNSLHEGLAYGLATAGAAITAGQVVKLSGNDVLIPAASATAAVLGIAKYDCADEDQPVVLVGPGVYETDVYVGNPTAGVELACDASTSNLKVAGGGERVIAQCLSCSGGVLRFKMI